VTIDNDTGLLERTLKALGRPAWEVTPEDIDRVVGDLAVAGRATSTRRDYVQIFKGFHRFLQARKAFRPDAAQSFDDRCLSWQMARRTVSIWTVAGRMKDIAFVGRAEHLDVVEAHRRGETDLTYRDGKWFLLVTCDVPAAEPNTDPEGWLGVDLGIVNIATTSDGTTFAGQRLNRYRRRQQRLRDQLQAKGTKSAKRKLKRRRRKERRTASQISHSIAKRIVTEAERTGRGIALEDLTGIRDRVRLRKPQRVTLRSWAFWELGFYIGYKAERLGVPVVFVDPRYTSQTCADCGHRERANRVSQSEFTCRSCGVVAHADRNAARNIAHRGAACWAAVNQPNAGYQARNAALRLASGQTEEQQALTSQWRG
jgi:IS605 OrfB family transposase